MLTLMLGAALLTAGVVPHLHRHAHALARQDDGDRRRCGDRALVGLLVIFGWPGNSYVILGTLLGIDLLFTGLMWVGFGLRLKSHA